MLTHLLLEHWFISSSFTTVIKPTNFQATWPTDLPSENPIREGLLNWRVLLLPSAIQFDFLGRPNEDNVSRAWWEIFKDLRRQCHGVSSGRGLLELHFRSETDFTRNRAPKRRPLFLVEDSRKLPEQSRGATRNRSLWLITLMRRWSSRCHFQWGERPLRGCICTAAPDMFLEVVRREKWLYGWAARRNKTSDEKGNDL